MSSACPSNLSLQCLSDTQTHFRGFFLMHVGIVKTIHPISYNKLLLFCKKKKKNYSKYLKPYLKDLTLIILSYVFVTRFFPNHDFAPLLELTFSKFFLAEKSLWTFKITHPAATSQNFALEFLTFHDSGVRKVKCQLWCDYVVGDVKNFYQSNDIKINNWKM